MLEQPLDHRWRRGHHISAYFGGFKHMDAMTHAGDKDLSREIIIVIDQANVADQLHTVKTIVIMPADKGRDEGRAGFGCQQRLVGRETERDIDHRAVAGQRLASLEAVDRQRHLDADIVCDLAQHFGFFHHRYMVKRDDFSRHRPIDDTANLARHLDKIAARLSYQRRVGRHPVKKTSSSQFLDVGDFGGIGEEFHGPAALSFAGGITALPIGKTCA